MNRNDEQLISSFMKANKQELADNGFSRRVMHKLPVSAKVWSDILTVVCVILCGVLLVMFDGFNVIFQSIREALQNQSMEITNSNLQTLLVALATLAFLCVRSVWTIKE